MSTLHPSPLGGRRPHRDELADFADAQITDRLPNDTTRYPVRLLIVGINPGLWTAAVNAPFSHPGNRFWPSLDRAGIVTPQIDATAGMSDADEQRLIDAGIAITNLVPRATARADELSRGELRASVPRLIALVNDLQPRAVAIVGITAFRTAFAQPRARLGVQDAALIEGWPAGVPLWVVPQPSGLNAHENIDTLAEKWRKVWQDVDGGETAEGNPAD
ncbi:mismatch-specific DNA-glycosylase [Rothia sp. LK2588]|uniref:mismatch-specific DNA-glycosylase n=1 Tax=Rothia sp. LK2588 TaxID=3114369 RepID=UPI0034CF8381